MSVVKHQSNCYRIIKGVRYKNWMDLVQGDKQNEIRIAEAKKKFSKIKKIKHWTGEYYQLFVAN